MRPLLALAALLVAACDSAAPARPQATLRERQEAAKVELSRTPAPRTYRYPEGELRVLDVPSVDRLGYVEQQRCFVWRDAEYRTASISCGQEPAPLVAN